MNINQISVFVENKPGCLSEITRTLAENGINILAFTLADTTHFGILRMIVNDADTAYVCLKEAHFTVSRTKVTAVKLEDAVGELDRILRILLDGGLSVEYGYSFESKATHSSVALLCLDDNEKGAALLREKGIDTLENSGLSDI